MEEFPDLPAQGRLVPQHLRRLAQVKRLYEAQVADAAKGRRARFDQFLHAHLAVFYQQLVMPIRMMFPQ